MSKTNHTRGTWTVESITEVPTEETGSVLKMDSRSLRSLEEIAEEADREIRNIGHSARRGDQSKAETFRFIRDTANRVISRARGEK